MKSIYVNLMSLGTQHTNGLPECPDYSFVHLAPNDITLQNKVFIIRKYGT